MTDYDNTNKGSLFRNDRKQSDRHPDHTGNATVQCPHCGQTSEFWLSAWVKQARNSGQKFFSLAFTAKEEKSDDDNKPF